MPLLHYLEQAQFQQADFEAALETELAMIGLSMASIVRSEAEELAIQAARLIDGGADANPAVMMHPGDYRVRVNNANQTPPPGAVNPNLYSNFVEFEVTP